MRKGICLAAALISVCASVYAQPLISTDGMIESSVGGFKFPDGSVQATAASQDEVRLPISQLPAVISSSGSYYLVSDLGMMGAGTAIDVNASNVTIDLMGFTLSGEGVGDNGVELAGVDNVEVRNGTITDFVNAGVYVDPGVGGDYHRAIDLRVSDSAYCIFLDGVANFIQGNTLTNCTTFGISAGWGSWVVDNLVWCDGQGIFVQGEGRIAGNFVEADNGISIGQFGTEIRNNAVVAANGISAAQSSLVVGNQVSGFTGNGIDTQGGCVVQDNSVIGAGDPSATCFEFKAAGNFYADNRASGCATAYDESSLNQRDGGGNWDGTVP